MIKFKFRERNRSILSLAFSTLFHLVLFFIAYYFANLSIKKISPNAGYVQVFTRKNDLDAINFENKFKSTAEQKSKPSSQNVKNKPAVDSPASALLNFIDEKADTTMLLQTYTESTFDITINYPLGWTFLDQNVNKKLEGVTFWASSSNINPPPYVHLEVCDRDLFNENKFKHKLSLRNAVVYFNDPEKLANYVSQVFYFRTEEESDFSLKLTVKGEDAFNSFAPTFYGMLKSFKFKDSPF